MKRLACLAVLIPVFAITGIAYAGNSEDLRFADGMFRRKWFDWASETACELAEDHSNEIYIRKQAAILHIEIIRTLAAATGEASYEKTASELERKYARDPGVSEVLSVELLKLKLDQACALATAFEQETDHEKREELQTKANGLFKELDGEFEVFIKGAREAVAQYPPQMQWGRMLQANPESREKLLNAVWARDYAEYLHASIFIYYGKVAPEVQRIETVKRGLKKFMRFIDGEQESDEDFDLPAKGQDGPQEPEPRMVFRMLENRAWLGMGRCYFELGQFEKAIEYFDYMVQAEIPEGSEKSPEDIAMTVDIRLQAFYLEGLAYNKWDKPVHAEKLLREMFDQSGKEIQPDRPEIHAYWKNENSGKTAFMPEVRETPVGKLAVLELGKALASQKRIGEASDEVLALFRMEWNAKARNPFEIEAAKLLAEIWKKAQNDDMSVGLRFAVAKGFLYKGQLDDAIYNFKKVYAYAGVQKGSDKFRSEALYELGQLLYLRERYLEAAIAFAELCESYPKYHRYGKTVMYLRQSLDKFRSSGEETRVFEESLPSEIGSDNAVLEFQKASDLLQKGEFREAGEIYGSIPEMHFEVSQAGEKLEKSNPFHAYAKSMEGYCYYMLFKANEKEPKAFEDLKKAVEILGEALKKSSEAEDAKAEAAARYYLAKSMSQEAWLVEDKAPFAGIVKILAAFEGSLKESAGSGKYAPGVLAMMAEAQYRLGKHAKARASIKKMTEKHLDSGELKQVCARLCELTMKDGDEAGEKKTSSVDFCKEAEFYLNAYYKAAGSDIAPGELLWVGCALFEVRSFERAYEVLEQFLAALSSLNKRTEEEMAQANQAKIIMAECLYETEKYREAAGLFDVLRRTVYCPKCGFEKVLLLKEFDKAPGKCLQCKRKENRLVKRNKNNLTVHEGAARSYFAVYEKLGMNDMVALSRAQDIYQRMLGKLRQGKNQEMYWNAAYHILKIYWYKRDFARVVGEVKNILLFSEGDWEKAIPVQPWRDMIKKLYEASLKAMEQN